MLGDEQQVFWTWTPRKHENSRKPTYANITTYKLHLTNQRDLNLNENRIPVTAIIIKDRNIFWSKPTAATIHQFSEGNSNVYDHQWECNDTI